MVTLPILQTQYGYSITKKPVFASIVNEFKSGREVINNQQVSPLWEFDLKYETLKDQTQNQTPYAPNAGSTAFMQLSELFLFCNGQYGRFLYEDLSDRSRTGQVLGTGDGVTAAFSIIESISDVSSGESFSFVVGQLNQGHPFTVYVNSVPQVFGVDYTVDSAGVQITFAAAPALHSTITMDFYFYYKCRFLSDEQEFDQFVKNWWTASIKFRSINTDPNNPASHKAWVIHNLQAPDSSHPQVSSAIGDSNTVTVGTGSPPIGAEGTVIGVFWNLNSLTVTATVNPPPTMDFIFFMEADAAGTKVFGEAGNFSSETNRFPMYYDGSVHLLQRGPVTFPSYNVFSISSDGTIGTGEVFVIGSPLTAQACYWILNMDNAPYHILPQLNSSSQSAAINIGNDSNTIVGDDDNHTGNFLPVVWSISGNTETTLNLLPGSISGSAINISSDLSIIVGYDGGPGFDTSTAVYWEWPANIIHALPTNAPTSFHRFENAQGISDDKTVICGNTTRGNGGSQAVVWRNGVIEVLPDFNGFGFLGESFARSISPDGNSVAGVCSSGTGLQNGCIWKYETVVDA